MASVRSRRRYPAFEQLDDFFAYDPRFTGGVRVAQGDVNGDGVADFGILLLH